MRHFHFGQALLPQGWADDVRITLTDGIVTSIETGVPSRAGDDCHAVVLPGLPNLHSHAFQRGMAGLAEARGGKEDSFWSWRELMYRFVGRLTPAHLQAIAALAYAEMLESGFVRVGEFHYLHHDIDGLRYADPIEMSGAIFAAAEESGIALTHLPVFYAHGGFGGQMPGAAQSRFVTDVDGFLDLHDRMRKNMSQLPDAVLGIAPHSLRAATAEELTALTASLSGPIHIHIAEQEKEVVDCLAWSGRRPVEWLLDHAAVDRSWCLVHATHITTEEAAAVAACGAVVGLCPITEANLGDGIFDADSFAGHYGIGSDSNVMIDAIEELRLLEYGQRLRTRRRNRMADGSGSTGGGLYRQALAGGAQALGAAAALSKGATDFVTLDMAHPSLDGRRGDAILDALIFASGSRAVDGVWRRGRQVVRGGRHVDRDGIAARYRATLRKLLA